MDLSNKDDPLSDDEVFFGKLTLKELKKHILWDKQREPWSISNASSPTNNLIDPNTSLQLIKTHSQPNLTSVQNDYMFNSTCNDSPYCKVSDDNDSFIKIENMVEQLCLTPKNNEKTELNNTLEVIEYILNNPPLGHVAGNSGIVKSEKVENKENNELDNTLDKPSGSSEMNQILKPTVMVSSFKSEGNLYRTNIIKSEIIFNEDELNKTPDILSTRPDGDDILTPAACMVSTSISEGIVDNNNVAKPEIIYKEAELNKTPHKPSTRSEDNQVLTPAFMLSTFKKEQYADYVAKPEIICKEGESNNSPDKILVRLENNHMPLSSDMVPSVKYCQSADKNGVSKQPYTPMKAQFTPRKENFTPDEIKSKAVFKTPGQPLSTKKPSATSLKRTPIKTNTYQHISSPVASYIKNCPIVPLVKDVHPKKPLPGSSSIPKFVKSSLPKTNKENVNLPSIAYKSAKKTKVIDIPDENKLPESEWAKKILSTQQKPLILKHNHREVNLVKKALSHRQEGSFADLSYHQAEVSVCTQKSAFKLKNNS